MNLIARVQCVVAVVLIATCQAGCGSGAPEGYARVSGRVFVDGSPAATGGIAFSPIDRMSPTSGGRIVDGEYSVVAPIGEAAIAVRVPKVVGEQKLYDSPDAPVQAIKTEALPAKYNDATELKFDVKPGDNTCDFDLRTR